MLNTVTTIASMTMSLMTHLTAGNATCLPPSVHTHCITPVTSHGRGLYTCSELALMGKGFYLPDLVKNEKDVLSNNKRSGLDVVL